MGLFGNLLKKNENDEKKVLKTVEIDLSKHQESLEKAIINLSKSGRVSLTKHTASVGVAMDYSRSMYDLYHNGSVQETITRLLPLALKFDDNKELESWLFSNDHRKISSIVLSNYQDYVKKVMLKSRMFMEGTNYAPVLNDIVKFYTDPKKDTRPSFVIFITDGENFDKGETDKVIRRLSKENIFIQFVGIGNHPFHYLKKLDNLSGRENDNTGFISVKNMETMSDEELYTELLRQYNKWLDSRQNDNVSLQ